jgi:predicted transcriptional regulator YheO
MNPRNKRSATATTVGNDSRVRSKEDWLIDTLAEFVAPFSRLYPVDAEVVLHDLRKLPNSIAAVSGSVTGRRIGDPATNVLLQQVVSGEVHDLTGYESRTSDGRRLRSSTTITRDADGVPIAALCVNVEIQADAAGVLAGGADGARGQLDPGSADAGADRDIAAGSWEKSILYDGPAHDEVPVRDVESLAALLLARAIEDEGLPISEMKKRHKIRVVGRLRDNGMFLLRDAIDGVAAALGVSRFTIYNYLNEIEGADAQAAAHIAAHAGAAEERA